MALGNGPFIKVKVEEVKKEGRRRGKMRIASFSRNHDVSVGGRGGGSGGGGGGWY